ncbi:MAG: hypothetical protein AAB904_00050, partial [Patescibacteria group bacterium]
HPAAALRSTAVLKELEEDFKRLPEIVKNPPSPAKALASAGESSDTVFFRKDPPPESPQGKLF